MTNKNSNQAGFSLIEIMVALGILSVAFISLMSSFPTALSISKGAENITVAAYLAQQKLEEVNSLGYENIATGTIESLHRLSATSTDPLYRFERETIITNVDGDLNASSTDSGLKKIQTTVYFHDPATRVIKSYSISILNSQK